MGKLAEAYVEIRGQTGPLESALGRVEGRLQNFILGAGAGMLAFRGFQMAAGFIGHAAQSAAHLGEVMNSTQVVFEGAAGKVIETSDAMARKFGMVKAESLTAITQIGQLGQAAGMSNEDAAALGISMFKLAHDLTSLRDIPFADSMEKISAGLVGMERPLREVGVLIDENAVKNRGLALHMQRLHGQFREGDKVRIRAMLITEGLVKSQGDLENTMGSTQNQLRQGEGRWENLSTTIGEKLLPAYTSLMTTLNEVLKGFEDSTSGSAKAFQWLADNIKSDIDMIGFLYRNWGDLTKVAGLEVEGTFTNIGETFTWLGDVIKTFLDWFGANWKTIFADAFSFVTTELANLGKNFQDLGAAFLKWIKDPLNTPFEFKFTALGKGMADLKTPELKIPELKLTDELKPVRDEIMAGIGKREQARDAAMAEADAKERLKGEKGGVPGGPAEKAPKFEEFKSQMIGMTDIVNEVTKAALGRGEKAADRTAKATEETAKKMDDVVDAIKNDPRVGRFAGGIDFASRGGARR